jgi:hypothetical protein
VSSVVETRKLGLAAYIKMCGGELLGIKPESNTFRFDTGEDDRSVDQWEMDYVNSCCHRHDTELVNLRKLMRR